MLDLLHLKLQCAPPFLVELQNFQLLNKFEYFLTPSNILFDLQPLEMKNRSLKINLKYY